MMTKPIGVLCAAIGMVFGLGACSDGYGYSGVSLGYGSASSYGDFYGYRDAGYGYGTPSYFGWYGDYYYPGSGVYVYDHNRRPYRWNGTQQRYWSQQQRYRGNGGGRGSWDAFDRGQVNGRQTYRQDGDARRWQSRGEGGVAQQQQRPESGWQGHRSDGDERRSSYTPDAQRFRDTPGGVRVGSDRGVGGTTAPRGNGGGRGEGRGGRGGRGRP